MPPIVVVCTRAIEAFLRAHGQTEPAQFRQHQEASLTSGQPHARRSNDPFDGATRPLSHLAASYMTEADKANRVERLACLAESNKTIAPIEQIARTLATSQI
jgi:hypothetical protein